MEGKKNNKLAVCVKNLIDLSYMAKTLELYFGTELKIMPLSLEDLAQAKTEPYAIVTTHLTTEAARKRFPNSKIIFTKRGLTGEALEEVVRLPRGTKALVVNSPKQVAIETKDALMELGIDHIDAAAYWPGAPINIDSYKVIIYAGIMDYCPQGDYQYINLEHRCIALPTILDIIRTFELPSGTAAKYYNDNIQQITSSCYKLAGALDQAEMNKKSFEKICDLSSTIIFAINDKGVIVVFNDPAVAFFSFSKESMLGKKYEETLINYPTLIEAVASGKELSEMIISVDGQKLLVSAYNFFIDDYGNRLISMLPVAALQQTESKARMKLHSSGFLAKYKFDDILGVSENIVQCKRIADIYANTSTTILITGESGTGKEVFAQAIHNASDRAAYPFVGINFAALPETLAESELFGYNEGAFTGATKGGKEGLFEIAHNGTILLDEIGDASLAVQAKLLRVLEEKEIIRIGGTKVVPINVRVICATNRNLEEMMKSGTFRPDLYYRIKALKLHLMPLRERKEDISQMLDGMLKANAKQKIINQEVQDYLLGYDWPGNTRELRTTAEYINMLADMSESGKHSETDISNMLRFFLESNLPLPNQEAAPCDLSIQKRGKEEEKEYVGEDLLLILRAISDLERQSIIAGRGSLSRMPRLQDAGLTETKLKIRLKRLESMGLLTVGSTKQGVTLTNRGIRILQEQGFK